MVKKTDMEDILLILDCNKCKKKMVFHPEINDIARKDVKTYPKGWLCDECAPLVGIHFFIDYNEYLQKQSIEAWK